MEKRIAIYHKRHQIVLFDPVYSTVYPMKSGQSVQKLNFGKKILSVCVWVFYLGKWGNLCHTQKHKPE